MTERKGVLFKAGVVVALLASVVWLGLHTVRLAEERDGENPDAAPPAPHVRNHAPATPTTYEKLPLGAATTLPYIDAGGQLHLGTAVLPVHGTTFAVARWTVLMSGDATQPGPVWIARDGTETQIPGAWTQPVLSKDGNYLYGFQALNATQSVLIAVRTDTGQEAGRLQIDGPLGGNRVVGSDRSRVYYRSGIVPTPPPAPGETAKAPTAPPLRAWEPGTAERHVSAPLGYQEITPLQRGVLLHNPGEWVARFAAIMPDHSLTQPGVHVPLPGTVADSPDGSAVVVARNPTDPGMMMFGTVRGVAANMSTGKITDLRVPTSVDKVYVAGFESAHSVILYTTAGTTSWYLRCWTSSGSCDRVKGSELRAGQQIRLPRVPLL
ncbi:MAG: hypothetical protein J2O46_09550 [Nocardioides sp.]|nr:hypothetical protein [Nocardioides sp.]